MTKHNLNTPASTDAENEISKMILQQVKNWNQGDIDSFMKPYENETPMTVNTEPPNFTAVVESQSAVTHRMIGLKRGRTRKSRFLKLAAIGSIFALAVFCTWWVLSHFKEEHQSWNELLVYIIQRLTT